MCMARLPRPPPYGVPASGQLTHREEKGEEIERMRTDTAALASRNAKRIGLPHVSTRDPETKRKNKAAQNQ
jgi:hypothetical protein